MLLLPVHASEPVETGRTGTITIEGYPGEGAHFYFYKVADVNENMEFTLTDTFRPYEENVILNDIHDQNTWAELAETLRSYAVGDKLKTYKSLIYTSGCKAELETGLYLMLSDPIIIDGWTCRTIPMFVTMPTADETTGDWIYDYTIVPKQEKEPVRNKETEYKVIKQWADGNGTKRPPSIKVNIIKNGVVYETVVLNKDNDWCYTWKAMDDGSEWYVQEVSIPLGYKVRISHNATTFILCNYTDAPNTSDPGTSKAPMIGLCLGGAGALLAGYLLLTGRKESK